MDYLILIINPGASSTKLGLFRNDKQIWSLILRHSYDELKNLKNIQEQKEFRVERIKKVLEEANINLKELSAISAIGGLLRPLKSGTYIINEKMLKDLEEGKRGFHASNLGGLIAYEIALYLGIPSFIVDPVSVDEMDKLARYSGHPLFERESLSHALNTKAVAKRWAKENGKTYRNSNLIVIHLGSGITVSAHKKGEMIDITNSMEEGPFSTERAGTVPCMKLSKLCFSGKYTFEEVQKMLFGEGGIYAYLGIKDFREVMERVRGGDEKAKEVVDAMIYQIAKDTGAMATVLEGKVDGIIITGGMAHEEYLVESLKKKTEFLSRIYVYPGEDELQALAEGALRVLRGEESALEYF
ncbi:MAG: butyrate kinase [Candidatus Aminicenantia bacterium]